MFCVWVQSYCTCSQEGLIFVHQTLAVLDSVCVTWKHPDFSSHAKIPDTHLQMKRRQYYMHVYTKLYEPLRPVYVHMTNMGFMWATVFLHCPCKKCTSRHTHSETWLLNNQMVAIGWQIYIMCSIFPSYWLALFPGLPRFVFFGLHSV